MATYYAHCPKCGGEVKQLGAQPRDSDGSLMPQYVECTGAACQAKQAVIAKKEAKIEKAEEKAEEKAAAAKAEAKAERMAAAAEKNPGVAVIDRADDGKKEYDSASEFPKSADSAPRWPSGLGE